MPNQQTPADILREQRAIIRTLRKNYPDGERRIALTDGAVAKYEQATHYPKMVELYALPCDEFQCNIDLLLPGVIDPKTPGRYGCNPHRKTKNPHHTGTEGQSTHCQKRRNGSWSPRRLN